MASTDFRLMMTADGSDDLTPTDEESFTYEADADESLTEAVITAVAAASGQRTLELEPLYDVINPDALNALFRAKRNGHNGNDCISFTYSGYIVSVNRNRKVALTEG